MPEAAEPLRLRVLTYNIRHTRGLDDVIDINRIAAVIRSTEPDLVALQEVDRGMARTDGVDQAAELGRLTGMHAVFGRSRDAQGGHYGNAILSRFPIVHQQVHLLPRIEREQRSALAVRVAPQNGEEIVFLSTHFDHIRDSEERLAQAEAMNELFAGDGAPPAILAGDLNDLPDSPTLQILEPHWTNTTADHPQLTFPARGPTRQIDYILFRPAGLWRVIETRVVDEPVASDHRPLLVVLERAPQQ